MEVYTMTQPNLVSFNISEADMAEIKASIETLRAKLLPHLKTLSPDERHELPKMGDKTVSFVQKTLEHCRQNSDLVPQFLNVDELAADVRAVETLRALHQPLEQINDALSDTIILSGSEAYSGSLLFYNSTKNAAKSKIQKAETIYNDLSARFPGRTKKVEPDTKA
jgi:hypothetical protein